MKSVGFFLRYCGLFCVVFALQVASVGNQSAVGQGAPEPAPADPASATGTSVSSWPEKAPDVFKVKFECSHGNIVLEIHKEWAPVGVDHFFELAKVGYYDGVRFFRVVPGFMAQFGISGDPAMTKKYGNQNIQDDPVKQSNTPGMMTYAKTQMPNSRSTQLFINTGDNKFLDGQGFAPFAKVIEGLDVVKNINSEYRERPDQMMVRTQGNAYLNKEFPNLDYIKKVSFVE